MTDTCPSLADIMREILLANELSGNQAAAYRFSDADGRAGRSGYSFGICQFDLKFNATASVILTRCGFSSGEISELKMQTEKSLDPYNAKLKAGSMVVDLWDRKTCDECLHHVLGLELPWVIPGDTLFHLADYHNQFNLQDGGQMHRYLQGLTVPATPEHVLDFKLYQTRWGKKAPADVHRRFDNIQGVLASHQVGPKAA